MSDDIVDDDNRHYPKLLQKLKGEKNMKKVLAIILFMFSILFFIVAYLQVQMQCSNIGLHCCLDEYHMCLTKYGSLPTITGMVCLILSYILLPAKQVNEEDINA